MNKILSIKDNVKHVMDESARAILNYTPQIYLKEHGKTDGTKIDPIASSVLVTHQDRFFLITAGHVVEENDPEDLGILIGNIFNILIGEVKYINPYLNELSNKIDIAIWELDNNLVADLKTKYNFLSIDNFALNHDLLQKDPRYLIVGFPWRRSKLNPINKKIKANPLIFLTHLAPPEIYQKLKLEDFNNMILDYRQRKIIDGKTDNITKGVTPEGISGCGVWFIEKFIYEPRKPPPLKLVSIITEQDKNKRYLQSTRIDIINEILIDHFKLNIKHSEIVKIK